MTTTRDHPARTPALGRYQIEPGSSAVTFATRHLFGLGRVRGTLSIESGTVDVAEPLACSRIEAILDTASFGTRNPQRDGAVRSAGFLDTRRFPRMTFRAGGNDGPGSTVPGSTPDGTGRLAVPGELTVRDVTRPVSLDAEFTAVTPESFTVRATTRIDRTDFGITRARGLAARYLVITVEVQCARS
jgi:polyisoprenoid-binding protein YceI